MITFAPSFANSQAIALPIPLVEPVTNAVLPFKSSSNFISSSYSLFFDLDTQILMVIKNNCQMVGFSNFN
jgi:hypothetical protein